MWSNGYDNVGNRTHLQRNHRPNAPIDVYEYDGLYQLIEVWYQADAPTSAALTSYATHQDYSYDPLGNRLSLVEDDGATSDTEDYGPHDGSQLLNLMNRYETVENQPLSYDPRGNTLSDGQQVYTYDILNRQTSLTNTGGNTEYIYDARGRRIAKIVNGTTIHFIYDINYRVIEERDGSEALTALYTYGIWMDEPLTMERGGQTYYYHRDALGSITEVSDNTGTIVERYEYDVYGEVSVFDGNYSPIATSAIGNPYLFTGRRYDEESGNYYYRARIYSPSLGRFLSIDPLGFGAGDYNLYRYSFNNPTTLADPTGEFAIVPWLLKAGAEAAVDVLAQVVINYYFDPSVNSLQQAVDQINYWQVGGAFVTGLLPGGRAIQSVAGAGTDVFLTWLDAQNGCQEYPLEQMVQDFALSFVVELIGSYAGDFAAKYGTPAVEKGLKKLGVDEATIKRLTKNLDDGGSPDVCNTGIGCDLIAPQRQQHILYGDATGGGHLWPGAPGKTPFPQSWNANKILDEIADIVTDPQTQWYAQTGNGGYYTNGGNPAIWRAWETRDNVQIRVVYKPATGEVITGFPDHSTPSGIPVP